MADKSKKAAKNKPAAKPVKSSELDEDMFYATNRKDYEKATKAANKSARKK
jgi:hypothetical protein